MKKLFLCMSVTAIVAGHYVEAMENQENSSNQKLVAVKAAIDSGKFCTVFAQLEHVDATWFKQNKKEILATIEATKLKWLGVRKEDNYLAKMTEIQKEWLKPLDLMCDGVTCLEEDFNQKEMQAHLNERVNRRKS